MTSSLLTDLLMPYVVCSVTLLTRDERTVELLESDSSDASDNDAVESRDDFGSPAKRRK